MTNVEAIRKLVEFKAEAQHKFVRGDYNALEKAMCALADMDAKHAAWYKIEPSYYLCLRCQRYAVCNIPTRYCPHCGAIMDQGELIGHKYKVGVIDRTNEED